MKPFVLVAGMARAGSMWTYNVSRELLQAQGFVVLPEEVPVNSDELLGQLSGPDPGSGSIYCIKTHKQVEPIAPYMRILSPYRDIRDAILSLMKFMKCSFEQALLHAELQMATADYYLQQSRTNVLPIRYGDIMGDPRSTIGEICRFLNLDVNDNQRALIAERYSIPMVKARLDRLVDNSAENVDLPSTAPNALQVETIENVDGSYRIFDKQSGFQTNHITASEDGGWRTELTASQQEKMMNKVAPWLKRHGFIP